jgi:hypothetical protein
MITPRWILGFIGHRRVEDLSAAKRWIHEALSSIKKDVDAKGAALEVYLSCAIAH